MTTAAAASPKQFEFLVRITLPDGSRGTHRGHYASGSDAILRAMEWFEPKSVSAVRAPDKTVTTSLFFHPVNPVKPL
jgi:hypothetical protein